MVIKNFFFICSNILFCKKIILINSPLQFLNFNEFINYDKKILENHKYIFLAYLDDQEINIINNINEKIYRSNYTIISFKRNINISLLHFIIKFRKFFLKKIQIFIFGDYNYYLNKEIYKISKSKVMLDDGNSSLLFNQRFQLSKKNLKIFTIYNKKYFSGINIIKNDFIFFKKFIRKNKSINKNINYFIGSPFVEKKILSKDQYIFFIKKVIANFNNKEFIYVPHPYEKKKNYCNYNFKKMLIYNSTFELFLSNLNFYPNLVTGSHSTLFVTIKKIFKNNIKLKPFFFEVNSKFKATNYDAVKSILQLTNNYLSDNVSKKIKKIIINT